MMDTAGQHRKIAEFLRDNQEKLLPRWAELASTSSGYQLMSLFGPREDDVAMIAVRRV